MRPEDYILADEEGTCFVCLLSAGTDPMWTLGDSFLRGYYSTYDHENKQFGFVPNVGSVKPPAYLAETTSFNQTLKFKKQGRTISYYILKTLLVILITTTLILAIYFGLRDTELGELIGDLYHDWKENRDQPDLNKLFARLFRNLKF